MSSSQTPLVPPRPTGTPSDSGRSTPNLPSDLSGVELLQLSQHVRFVQRHRADEKAAEEEVELAKGDALSVQLVTVDVSQAYGQAPTGETDIFLVLSIPSTDFTLPLLASQTVLPDRRSNAYVFESQDVPDASIVLYLYSSNTSSNEKSSSASSSRNVSAFEDILASYCAFQDDHSPEDRGKIELISAEDGSVLGTVEMPNGMVLQEDPSLGGWNRSGSTSSASGLEKEPVLIDLDFDETGEGKGKDGQQIISVVRPFSRYEESKPTEMASQAGQADSAAVKSDWMLRGADYTSRGIINGGAALGNKMQAGADAYGEYFQSRQGVQLC
jgi:spartin